MTTSNLSLVIWPFSFKTPSSYLKVIKSLQCLLSQEINCSGLEHLIQVLGLEDSQVSHPSTKQFGTVSGTAIFSGQSSPTQSHDRPSSEISYGSPQS